MSSPNNSLKNCIIYKTVNNKPYPDTVDIDKCKDIAKTKSAELKSDKIILNLDEEKLFNENMLEFKTSEIVNKVERIIAEEILELETPSKDPKKQLQKIKPAKFDYKMGLNAIAYAGLSAIGILTILSVYFATFPEDDTLYKVSLVSTQILSSEFMLVLTTTVIAPVITRVFKEKYDIDIESSQFALLMKDGIGAVAQYHNLANKLRDEEGKIPVEQQKKLKNLAIQSLSENLDPKKYKNLISSVGGQIFERAIESAVKNDKDKRMPIERGQVEELIKQAIDARPQMAKWGSLDDNVKKTFIEGNVKRLLKNFKIEGWGYHALSTIFDSEASDRLVQAALIEKAGLIEHLENADKPYLQYSSSALDAIIDVLLTKKSLESSELKDQIEAARVLKERREK